MRTSIFQKALILVTLFILISSAACNYTATNEPTRPVLGGPNLTLTALFSSVQRTETPGPAPTTQAGVPTETSQPVPSETLALPTSTAPVPSETVAPATATTTLTPIPQSQLRAGASAKAAHISSAILIDANLDDWQAETQGFNAAVYGSANRSGDGDLNGAFKAGWDATFLYLGVTITDDVYAQNATKEQIYKGDIVEILFDAALQADFTSTTLSEDDYQIGLAPGRSAVGTNLETWMWYPRGRAGVPQGVKVSAVSLGSGYRIEAAIPWSLFGVNPAAGQHYGFAVSASDNDNTSENVQQSMISFAPRRSLVDPTTWVDLELLP